MRILDPALSAIGERLRKARATIAQKPMPWRFLDLLCQLDEKEEAEAARQKADLTAKDRHFKSERVP